MTNRSSSLYVHESFIDIWDVFGVFVNVKILFGVSVVKGNPQLLIKRANVNEHPYLL